ncbi:MAG: glycosyl transferase [Desulfobulbaceae bacterium DB1]|nr:MAG: glycosyl transferase [Desulfobulbaceae bacterium DB1]
MQTAIVAHLTTVHPRNDTRIFIKQCRSLAAHGYEVILVVADGQGDDTNGNVRIVDVGHLPGRLNRIFKTTRRVLKRAIELDADLYHFHDPELIPVGLKLKRLGKKVVFDSHEDVPKQLLGKPYLNPLLLRMLSGVFSLFERYACRRFDAIVAATPFIRDKFLAINPNTVDINNFPMLGELAEGEIDWRAKHLQVAYIGGIARIRGIMEVVQALGQVQSDVRLKLGGRFGENGLAQAVQALPGWQRVDALGFIDRAAVRNVLRRSVAGLVTLHPQTNYLDALPVKMFEYMSAGVPVIASNFPLWREIVEGNDCGLCVDPLNPAQIAEAIDFLVNNPERAEQMGRNGQKAVQARYNWGIEEQKLLRFYQSF